MNEFWGRSFDSEAYAMSAKPRKFLITTETHELYIVRNSEISSPMCYCDLSGPHAEMLTLGEAVSATGIRAEVIFGLLARGILNFTETNQGQVFICVSSLYEVINGEYSNRANTIDS